MQSLIDESLLTTHWDLGEWGHTTALAPFLAVHAAYAERRHQGRALRAEFAWEWTEPRAVEECLAATWTMTGRWKARRPFAISRARFEERILDVVPPLARGLKTLGAHCMRDLQGMNPRDYTRAMTLVHHAVQSISKLRPTKEVEPVLGSKVLHHYFPSLVPVFDTAFIRNAVLKSAAARTFVETDSEGWVLYDDARAAGGPAMLQFHHYSGFVAAQIGSVPMRTLSRVRERFARGFFRLAPGLELERRHGIVRRLDAKLAEYCLIGQAAREGLF